MLLFYINEQTIIMSNFNQRISLFWTLTINDIVKKGKGGGFTLVSCKCFSASW